MTERKRLSKRLAGMYYYYNTVPMHATYKQDRFFSWIFASIDISPLVSAVYCMLDSELPRDIFPPILYIFWNIRLGPHCIP